MAKAVCTAAVSSCTNAFSTFFFSFLRFNKKRRKSLPIYSLTSSPWSCDSNLHLILLQYSGDTGDTGSCSEQQRRPSRAEDTRAPFSWSLQNERGQNSQKDTAAPPHSSHWCHGHSHFPSVGGKKGRIPVSACPQHPRDTPLPTFLSDWGLNAVDYDSKPQPAEVWVHLSVWLRATARNSARSQLPPVVMDSKTPVLAGPRASPICTETDFSLAKSLLATVACSFQRFPSHGSTRGTRPPVLWVGHGGQRWSRAGPAGRAHRRAAGAGWGRAGGRLWGNPSCRTWPARRCPRTGSSDPHAAASALFWFFVSSASA